MRTIFAITAFMLAATIAQANPASELPAKLKASTGSSQLAPNQQAVYAVTGETPTAFYAEPKEDAKMAGVFPPARAVWLIRPQGEWALVRFEGISAWVKRDKLKAIFTIDEPNKEQEK